MEGAPSQVSTEVASIESPILMTAKQLATVGNAPETAPCAELLHERLTLLKLQDSVSPEDLSLSTLDKDARPTTTKNSQGPCTPARGYSKPILPKQEQDRTLSQSQASSQASSSATLSSAAATARLLNHFLPSTRNDLTPVMRNTRHGTEYMHASGVTPLSFSQHHHHRAAASSTNLVSPEEDALRGEAFLRLPDGGSSKPGPSIPLMQSHSKLQGTPTRHHAPAMPEPLSQCRHYSLTSLSQYVDDAAFASSDATPSPPDATPTKNLTPYQPSRPQMMNDVLTLSQQKDLDQIFIPRRTVSVDKQHRFDFHHHLSEPIPMDERVESIPSIHMAHNFENGSVTTCGDYDDDDEDSIVRCSFDDDASWSSRGSKSSLYMDETDCVPLAAQETNQRVVILPARSTFMPRELHMDMATTTTNTMGDHHHFSDKRSLRRKRKQDRAYQWLQSVEATPHDLAEAASSKFLLTPTSCEHHQAMPAVHETKMTTFPSTNEMSSVQRQQQVFSPVQPTIRPRQFLERRQSSPATIFQG
ncbi:hypothetical protein MPSEU_000446900 [Mayamaea pseudoterrestris]|nr:hypothetical protein MPSEU_000446900 [Mayamaea pseudoterrestris]